MNVIVAVDANWAIGLDGDQLCYIPADLKRFQKHSWSPSRPMAQLASTATITFM